jgi:hypothetical protein
MLAKVRKIQIQTLADLRQMIKDVAKMLGKFCCQNPSGDGSALRVGEKNAECEQ